MRSSCVDFDSAKSLRASDLENAGESSDEASFLIRGSDLNAFVETTQGIRIIAYPLYVEAQSNPIMKKFVFAYFVRIENNSDQSVQLLRRHWFIRDSNGKTDEVEGAGVVGQQPFIPPGHAHEYNSFCVLETFEGAMKGTYLMQRENGEQFKAVIPRFILRAAAN